VARSERNGGEPVSAAAAQPARQTKHDKNMEDE